MRLMLLRACSAYSKWFLVQAECAFNILSAWSTHLLAGKVVGGPNSDTGTDTVVVVRYVYICSLWSKSFHLCIFFSSSGKKLNIFRRSQQIRRSYLDSKVISRVQRQCALFRSSGSENIINFAWLHWTSWQGMLNQHRTSWQWMLNQHRTSWRECLINIEQADRECA